MAASLSSPSIGITANNNNDAATEALIARLIAEDLDGDNAASAFSNDAPQQGKPSAMTWGGDDDENGKGGIYDDGNIVGEEVESTGRWDDAVAGGSSVFSSSSSNWQWDNTTATANTTILPIRDAQQQQHNQEADIQRPIATTTTARDGDLSTITATATATVEDDTKIAARSNPERKERGKGKGKERKIIILEESPYNEKEDDDDDSFDEPYDNDYDDGHVDLTLIIGRKLLSFSLSPVSILPPLSVSPLHLSLSHHLPLTQPVSFSLSQHRFQHPASSPHHR